MGRSQIDLLFVVITAVGVFVALFLGIAVFNEIAGSPNGEFVKTETNLETAGTGNFVAVSTDGLSGDNQTVYNSRGNAVYLKGTNDSYVQSDNSFTLASDDTWTVSTQARVANAAKNTYMTAVSANGRVMIQYDGSNDRWSVYYFDDGSADSYRANVSAPNQPGNFSLVTATHNGTHLTVWRNTTKGDVVNTSTDGDIASVGVSSQNWVGTIEETRTFDDSWNASLQSQLNTSPIDPIVANRTARLMYDRGSGSTVLLFWAPTDATLSNGTWVDGLPGETMDRKSGSFDPVGKNDYRWKNDGPEILVVEGGRLEDAPVAWVDYTKKELSTTWSEALINWIGLAGLVPVVMLLVSAVSYLLLIRD